MDDEELALRSLFAGAFQGGVPTDACPSPERLFDAFHGVCSHEERLEVLDHLAGCAVCADAWRLASRTRPPEPA